MKQINNWENVKAASGEIPTLPAGGYVCKVEACSEKPNKSGAGTHLEIKFDIAEGEYAGFYLRDWQAQTGEDRFWRGVINQNVPNEASDKYGQQCGFFKRFTETVEESNPGYHWDWNEAALAGKMIGVVFGAVERESAKGTRYLTTRADKIITVEDVKAGKFKVPAAKLLPTQPVYQEINTSDPDVPF